MKKMSGSIRRMGSTPAEFTGSQPSYLSLRCQMEQATGVGCSPLRPRRFFCRRDCRDSIWVQVGSAKQSAWVTDLFFPDSIEERL
jgi:hypothetical protein